MDLVGSETTRMVAFHLGIRDAVWSRVYEYPTSEFFPPLLNLVLKFLQGMLPLLDSAAAVVARK